MAVTVRVYPSKRSFVHTESADHGRLAKAVLSVQINERCKLSQIELVVLVGVRLQEIGSCLVAFILSVGRGRYSNS